MRVSGRILTGFFAFAVVSACARGDRREERRKKIAAVQEKFRKVDKEFSELSERLNKAAAEHRREYIDEARGYAYHSQKFIVEARAALIRAQVKRGMDFAFALGEAELKLAKAETQNLELKHYLELLDIAQGNYRPKLEHCRGVVGRIKSLVSGFINIYEMRAEYFFGPMSALDAIGERLDAQKSRVGSDSDDYLGIWRSAEAACREAEAAYEEASKIHALPKENEKRRERLLVLYDELHAKGEAVFSAARGLESYPSYRCLKQVTETWERFGGVRLKLEEAAAGNSMERQEFQAAKELLDSADEILQSANKLFGETLVLWEQVKSAVSIFAERDSRLSFAIRDAEHLSVRDTGNRRQQVRKLLAEARRIRGTANLLRANDPIRALQMLDEALVLVRRVYSVVDGSIVVVDP